jgi:hypothetical protein
METDWPKLRRSYGFLYPAMSVVIQWWKHATSGGILVLQFHSTGSVSMILFVRFWKALGRMDGYSEIPRVSVRHGR